MERLLTYEKALDELRERAESSDNVGDVDGYVSISKDADELEQWLRADKAGPCPVDLAGHSMEVVTSPDPVSSLDENIPDVVTAAQFNQGEPVVPEDQPDKVASDDASPPSREQEKLLEKWNEAQKCFTEEHWLEALNMSAEVEESAQDITFKESAASLKDRAQRMISQFLDRELENGVAAQRAGDEQAARGHYQAVLEINPDNTQALQAQIELGGLTQADPQREADKQRLASALKERKDITRLEKAVYEGEAWRANDKLPADLVDLLIQARQYFDDLRKQMGRETTMARFGDLEAVKKAWEMAIERRDQDFEFTYDSVTGKNVSTIKYIGDCEVLFKSESAKTAEFEISFVSRNLPKDPQAALQRLGSALKRPFHKDHIIKLEEKKQEALSLLVKKKKAEGLLGQAERLKDPVEILKKVDQANTEFPYINNIENIRKTWIENAINSVSNQVKEKHSNALRGLKKDTNVSYGEAREEIKTASSILDSWPFNEKPELFKELRAAGSGLRDKINDRETLRAEFENRVKEIRKIVADAPRRSTGQKLFKELKDDQRFDDFLERRALISEMDQYVDFSEQLTDAHLAKEKGDWGRVYELAVKMKQEGSAGASMADVDALRIEALLEFDIVRAGQYLGSHEIVEAKEILDRIINVSDEGEKEKRKTRLESEFKLILQCIENTPAMQQQFDKGLNKAGLGNNPLLKVFLDHHIDKNKPADLAWMHQTDQTQLKKVFEKHVGDSVSILQVSEGARILLHRVLAGRPVIDRVDAMQLFLVVQGNPGSESNDAGWKPSILTADAGRMARLLSQSLRQDVLESLLTSYRGRKGNMPDTTHIYRMAENARLLREVNLLGDNNEREAAGWFELEKGKLVATALEKEGDWAGAVTIWQDLNTHHPGQPEVKSNLNSAKKKQNQIQAVLDECQAELNTSRRKALKILKEALKNEITKGETVLLSRFEEVFRKIQNELIEKAREENDTVDIDSISRAVLALYELEEIEGIYEQPVAERESQRQLDLMKTRLQHTYPDLVKKLPQLADLYNILRNAELPEVWDTAILGGNFTALEGYWKQIDENLQLGDIATAKAYKGKLDEWREVHNKLNQNIGVIQRFFEVDEKFIVVVISIDGNANRPLQRGNNSDWKYLQPEDYDHIRTLMSGRMVITDSYTPPDFRIIGWEAIRAIAVQREKDYAVWVVWQNDFKILGLNTDEKVKKLEGNQAQIILAARQEKWENVSGDSVRLIKKLYAGPKDKDGNHVPCQSHKAELIREDGKQRQLIVRGWIHTSLESLNEINNQIIDLGGFPSPEEFQAAATQVAQRDCTALEAVLKRADAVGAGNSLLMDSEFKFAVTLAGKRNNFAPLETILAFIDHLQLDGIPNLEDFKSQNSGGVSEPLLTKINNISVMAIFKEARAKVYREDFSLLERYLLYADSVRMKRKQEEQKRVELYRPILKDCQTQKPSFIEVLKSWFGW